MSVPSSIQRVYAAVAVASIAFSMTSSSQAGEPIAKRVPHELKSPNGHVRQDPYFWLREREDKEVIDYLKAENAFYKKEMADTEALQKELFEEIKGRIKQDDSSVPDRKSVV